MKKIGILSTIIFLTTIISGFMSFSGAEDTQDDNYCYFKAASVDVRVKV